MNNKRNLEGRLVRRTEPGWSSRSATQGTVNRVTGPREAQEARFVASGDQHAQLDFEVNGPAIVRVTDRDLLYASTLEELRVLALEHHVPLGPAAHRSSPGVARQARPGVRGCSSRVPRCAGPWPASFR